MKIKTIVLMAVCHSWSLYCQQWIFPQHDAHFSYLFAPGILSCETIMANYCPTFIASTGEQVIGSKGIEVITQPATTINLAEIQLKRRHSATTGVPSTLKDSLKKIFVVGPLKLIGYISSSIIHRMYGISVQPGESETEHSVRLYWINPRNLNIGQEDDIRLGKTQYDNHIGHVATDETKKHQMILYGTSRGAATLFNIVARFQPQEVKALVCEGMFDSIANIKKETHSLLGRSKLSLLSLTNYKPDGIAPLDVVDAIPHNLPILLITSYKDFTVPWQCTFNMYQQLRNTGHLNAHILILKQSPHPRYTYHNKEDRDTYQAVVHAFYRHYGLPYIEAYAELGQQLFEATQPPV